MSSQGTHIDIVDKTIERIDDIGDKAEQYTQVALDSMDALASAAETQMNLSAITYFLDTGDWSGGYVGAIAPTEPTFDSEAPTVPVLPTLDIVAPFDKGTAPDDTVDLSGAPGAAPATVLGALPTIASLAIPSFTSSVPVTDVNLLVASYSYIEPTYVELVKNETQTLLLGVLSGDKIIPDAIYDALWDRVVGDFGAVQIGDEWQASNLAASLSMSGMVSEALTVRLEAAQQRTVENVSKARLEQAIQEAQHRREDLWSAVGQGIAFESMWLGHHEALSGRALASAAKAHEAVVAVHNANVARFNVVLARVDAEIASKRLELDLILAPLQEVSARLELARVGIAQDDQYVKRWLGEWSGYQINKQTAVQVLAERIRAYSARLQAESTRLNGDIAYQGLRLKEGDQSLQNFATQWQGLANKANAINTLYGARIEAAALSIRDQQAKLGYEQMKLNKSIEEALRKPLIDIEKARLQLEQSLGVLEKIANLQTGLAQAYLAGSDVALGASATSDVTYTYSGSA